MEYEKVTISKEEYNNLLKSTITLRHLEDWGIDEWEWYEDCMQDLKKDLEVSYKTMKFW